MAMFCTLKAVAVIAAVALCGASETLTFEQDVHEDLRTFEVMKVGKQGQWNECSSKKFAMHMDEEKYGTDHSNLALYCAAYCRQFVDVATKFVNLDDRSDKGGSYACYCSSNCDTMCQGTPVFETTTVMTTKQSYDALAFYYNTYNYYGSSNEASWTFPYIDDSQHGHWVNHNSDGIEDYMTSQTAYYYYYGSQYGSASYVLSGNDYAGLFVESDAQVGGQFSQWVMECDDGELMDFENLRLDEQGVDYTPLNDGDVDYSDVTRANFEEVLQVTATTDAKCMPVKLFQYGSVTYSLTVEEKLDPENWFGIPEEISNGVTNLCNQHLNQADCEGFKMYGYGGYTCSGTSSYSSSSNFAYSYYYDGSTIYHGDSTNCFDFDWDLQDQSIYGTTFTYYYYYYYSYIYVCDWTYDYESDDTSVTSALFSDFHLYAVLDDFKYEERYELYMTV